MSSPAAAQLSKRLDAVRRGVASVSTYRSAISQQRAAAAAEADSLRYKADLNRRSSEVIKKWLEDMLKSNVDSMSALVTSALRSVVFDQSLTFKTRQDPKYNRLSMSFWIEEDGVEADPLESFGGGPAVVASLVLRLAVMARLRMASFLILDESLFALALRYIPAAADFIRQLSEETGVTIFMVTHNEEFMANAHVAYDAFTERGADGVKSLKLRRRA